MTAAGLPENQARFSLDEVRAITGAQSQASTEGSVIGVTTDTRGALKGKLFVALTGERFDGHAFVEQAALGGAAAVLVERDVAPLSIPVLRVGSTYTALGQLAHAHRLGFSGRVVAVAGSAGKTSTRAAITCLLEALAPGSVHAVAGNLNNQVGVPLVLLGLGPERAAVVEIGTNQLGEVRLLSRWVQPDVGVLTLIGLEHTEGLGDIDQIETEEGALFEALASGAAAIGNVDDARVARRLALSPAARRVGYGRGNGASYRLLERRSLGSGATYLRIARPTGDPLIAESPLLGEAGAYAVLAACAAAETCLERPLTSELLGEALRSQRLAEPGRLSPVPLANGSLLIDDTYNANPASLASSIATAAELAAQRGGRLFLVLGEMRELGRAAEQLHHEAGRAFRSTPIEQAIFLGADAAADPTSDKHARAMMLGFDPHQERSVVRELAAVPELLLPQLAEKDVVLIKASRGVRAERVVRALSERIGRSA